VFHSGAALALVVVWIALTVMCVALGIYQVKLSWNALPINVGPISFSLTIYPPLVICVWMLFWLGFEWAFLSAYLSTFSLAVYSGMPISWALLFALVDPLALAVYALAYRTARIPFDLRSIRSALWFLFVSFVAAVAGSAGSFIWSETRGLSPVDTFAIWQGWWVGALLQAVLLNAPVLAIFGARLEHLKSKWIEVPRRPPPSLRWMATGIAAGGLVLAGYLLATGTLASTRLSQALANGVSDNARQAVLDATYSWKLTVWTGIMLTLAGSLGGILIAYGWNRSLLRQVRARTAELHETEQRFRVTFDQAAVGIAHVATDGRWLRVNQKLCDIVGYTREELTQRTFQDITHPEDLTEDMENVRKTLAGDIQTYTMQKRYVRKDGSLVWINLTVALVRGPRNEPGYFISIVEDINERKHLEEQLRQSQKMEAIGRLAGGVAHDFNNLLTVITGYGQMMLAELNENDPLWEKAKAICKSADRAATLTRKLLALSRHQVVQPRIVNLNDLVVDMGETLRRLLREDIELATILATAPAKVKTDPGQMEQVIINLAVNAGDAMPNGGKLTIEVANLVVDQEPQVMLSVRDNGLGMDAEVQSRLFEPFFTTKPRGEGTGLGLSIVYGIVKQSSGSIQVTSQVGHGSLFQVLLPAVADTVAPPESQKTMPKLASGSEAILLVEDGEDLRKLVGEVLRSNGYTVLDASNGEDALSVYRRFDQPISLLVTDIIMPGMNGRVLAERLREARPDMKVLYISGYTENVIEVDSRPGAGTSFLQKPFPPAVLTQKVRELLDKGS
jgi:PAS domain S-box-containing protein